jgi:hypothetical protein
MTGWSGDRVSANADTFGSRTILNVTFLTSTRLGADLHVEFVTRGRSRSPIGPVGICACPWPPFLQRSFPNDAIVLHRNYIHENNEFA